MRSDLQCKKINLSLFLLLSLFLHRTLLADIMHLKDTLFPAFLLFGIVMAVRPTSFTLDTTPLGSNTNCAQQPGVCFALSNAYVSHLNKDHATESQDRYCVDIDSSGNGRGEYG
jgi:hypothetical protein